MADNQYIYKYTSVQKYSPQLISLVPKKPGSGEICSQFLYSEMGSKSCYCWVKNPEQQIST